MFEDFARTFDLGLGAWPSLSGEELGAFTPRIDLRETDDEIRITAEIPGMEEKDFELSLADDVLTIKGEKRQEYEQKGEEVHRVECSYGAFRRVVPLPCEVEADSASAVYKNGALTVTLKKAPSARRQAHKIEVRSK